MIQSTLKMQMDFDRKVPVIEIIHRSSDETVDHLLQQYLQSAGHISRWLRLEYMGEFKGGNLYRTYVVIPQELNEEIKLMQAVVHEKVGVPSVGYPKQGSRQSNRSDLWSPTEKAINDVMQQVEKLGASTKLTNAVIKLQEAQNLVYEHLEGIE
jgi:hypothetical protein